MRPRGGPVEVTSKRGRRRTGILVHECDLHPEDRALRAAIPVTSPARTLFDLAEVLEASSLERVWEEADRLNLLEIGGVDRVCRRGRGRRAVGPIGDLIRESQAAERHRSPLEDRFAAFCREHGIPPPVTNVLILGYEVDALWPRQRLIVELDGFAFHRHRAAFERDRARDAVLLVAGYHVIRVTHRRLLDEADELGAQIRELLKRA
jgi:hypothetical protein